MQCPGCGKPVTDGVSVCLKCGTPLPRDFARKGTLVAELRPDPVPFSGDNWPAASAPTSPYSNPYASFPSPPPPTAPIPSEISYPVRVPRFRRWRVFLALFLVLAALGSGSFALLKVYAQTPTGNTTASGGGLGTLPVDIVHRTCAPEQVSDGSSNILQAVQMTSGLVDAGQQNYAPIDTSTTFAVGKTAYITFTVGSIAQNGTLSADWCLGSKSEYTRYASVVSVADKDVLGYFSVRNIDKTAVGASKVVLWWQPENSISPDDGQVVAVEHFTVVAGSLNPSTFEQIPIQ